MAFSEFLRRPWPFGRYTAPRVWCRAQKTTARTASLRETPTTRGYTRLQAGPRMLYEDRCPLRFQAKNLKPEA